jgi:hypothetical protein
MLPLKTTLTVNALSSGATGILLIAFAHTIATLFGVSDPLPFIGTGIFLVVFAGYVLITALQTPLNNKSVRRIIALDILWVLGSLVLLVAASGELSMIGILGITAVAAWVASMALLQRKGLTSLQQVR